MFSSHRFPGHGRERGRLQRTAILISIPVALGLIVGFILPIDPGKVPFKPVAANLAMTPGSAASSASPAPNANCRLIVPANPLTAQGLATPYQLEGPPGMPSPQRSGCTMANAANLGAFVQATILDPATGKLSTYEPLVITRGTQPAVQPVVPQLPRDAVVTIDIGFNGNTLTLVGATPGTLAGAHAVTGLPGSPFGQVSFLNGVAFFRAAFRAIQQGKLTIPPTGTTTAGEPCPTTRSFDTVDQDQSDNVTTQYLVTGDGRTAQNNAANMAALPGATLVSNGSDNFLLGFFLDPALGCKPFTAPNLTNGGQPGTSQALDELSAAANQRAPLALVPVNDPMTLVGDAFSIAKTNLFRTSVGQPPLPAGNTPTESAAIANENAGTYCQNLLNIQTPFLAKNRAALRKFKSPVPATGTNLFTFMANRLSMSFTNLNCQNFGLHNTVKVTLNGNGTAVAATLNTTPQVADFSRANGKNPVPETQPNHAQNTGQHGQVCSVCKRARGLL
jgi:hypothetical protein